MQQSQKIPCFLDGSEWWPSGQFTIDDATTGNPRPTVASVTEADVPKLLASSAAAFPSWKRTPAYTRREIFQKAAALLRARSAQVAKVIIEDTTAGEEWANIDLAGAIEILEETAALATRLRAEFTEGPHGKQAYTYRVPYGVVLGIAPWNAPMILGLRSVANAIMAGNTAILKTSEHASHSQLILAKTLAEAGLPKGVLNCIHVEPSLAGVVVQQIIAHPKVGKINFTGSTFVGRKIAEVCAYHLKPVVLELGGKAPFIVLEDADLPAAAQAALLGGFLHSGQICMSTDRVYVHSAVRDRFVELVQKGAEGLRATPSGDGNSCRGLFTSASAGRIAGLLNDAVSKGADVLVGGSQPDNNVMQPTVLANISAKMRLAQEEIFGPMFTINMFNTRAEAIELANDCEYGLAAAIWSRDVHAALDMAEEIESGMIHINGITVHDVQTLAHGGFKKSGYGRFNGINGLLEFTQTKVVTVQK